MLNINFCNIFDRMQATVEHVDKNVICFANWNFRSVKDEHLQAAMHEFKDTMIELGVLAVCKNGYQVISEEKARKSLIYLALNVDVTSDYDLTKDSHISHLVGVGPQIPTFLFASIVWECKLESYFYQFLTFGPPNFTVYLLNAAEKSLKYLNEQDRLQKIIDLIGTIVTIATLTNLEINGPDFNMATICLQHKAIVSKLFQHFHASDERLFKIEKRSKYLGLAMKGLLSLAHKILHLYDTAHTHPIQNDMNIFENMKHELDISRVAELAHRPDLIIFLRLTLNTLESLLKKVTFKIFMRWVEIEDNDQLNLQLRVGDLVHNLRLRLCDDNVFKHSVIPLLEPFQIKVPSLGERLKQMQIGDLLHILESPVVENSTKALCLDELLCRSIIFGNSECLEAIRNNYRLLTIAHCEYIIKYIEEFHRFTCDDLKNKEDTVDLEDYLELVDILGRVYESLDDSQKIRFLYSRDALAPSYKFTSTDNYIEKTTHFWNQRNGNINISKFLLLCFENPQYMYQTIFDIALDTPDFNYYFVEVLHKTSYFCMPYIKHALCNVFLSPSRTTARNFKEVITFLFRDLKFLDSDIVHAWIESLHIMRKSINFESLLNVVKLHKVINEVKLQKNIGCKRLGYCFSQKLILNMAFILDSARWTPEDFSIVRLELTVEAATIFTGNEVLNIGECCKETTRMLSGIFQECRFSKFTTSYLTTLNLEQKQNFGLHILPKSPSLLELSQVLMMCTGREIALLATICKIYPNSVEIMLNAAHQTKALNSGSAICNFLHTFSALNSNIVASEIYKRIRCRKKLKGSLQKLILIFDLINDMEFRDEISQLVFTTYKIIVTSVNDESLKRFALGGIKKHILQMCNVTNYNYYLQELIKIKNNIQFEK